MLLAPAPKLLADQFDKLAALEASNVPQPHLFLEPVPDIRLPGQCLQVARQPREQLVLPIARELGHGQAVAELEAEAVGLVVDDHGPAQVQVLDHPQVLDVEPIPGLQALLPVQQAVDRVAQPVYVPDYRQRVRLGGRAEDVDVV